VRLNIVPGSDPLVNKPVRKMFVDTCVSIENKC
jgi:hypothetical protein